MMMFSMPPVYWKTAACIGLVEVALLLLFVALVRLSSRRDRNKKGVADTVVVAFFHPRCTGGGGGERVLWKMVQVLGELSAHSSGSNGDKKKQIQVIIYTIDAMTETYERDVRQHVLDRFSLQISPDLQLSFVHLDDYAHLLRPATRSFSLLVESLGAMRLAFVALQMTLEHAPLTVPHLFVDTTGCAFTYLPARLLFGCRVLAYVHYPTLSTDMLHRVWERRRTATYNHAAHISNSLWKTYAKLLYYVAFAALYGAVGSLATLVLVNSTWTYNHVRSLWKWAAWRNRIRIVYPPCSFVVPAAATKSRDDDDRKRNPVIVSIGQFRPEKDHVLQIESMARLLKQHPEWKRDQSCKLVLIGSCREGTTANNDDNDGARLQKLRQLCDTLEIADHVEFVVNQPFSVLQEWLQKASVGIHTVRSASVRAFLCLFLTS